MYEEVWRITYPAQPSKCRILKDSEARRTSRTGRIHAPLIDSFSWWKTGEWQQLRRVEAGMTHTDPGPGIIRDWVEEALLEDGVPSFSEE